MAYKKRPTTNPILPVRRKKRSKNGFRNIRKVIIISTYRVLAGLVGQGMFLSFPRKGTNQTKKVSRGCLYFPGKELINGQRRLDK